MKKLYTEPRLDVVFFEAEDIMLASGTFVPSYPNETEPDFD